MSCDTTDDPHLADALAQAERRRAMLQELAEIGMNLARDVGAHAAAAMSAINEDNGGDPTRAFATVSRAVRLTLAMEARNDAHILALRNGRVPLGWAGAARPASRGLSPAADRRESAGEGPGALREHLIDREDEEAFLDLPFEAGVEAIRYDLGLSIEDVVAGEGAKSIPHPPEEAGEGDREAVEGAAKPSARSPSSSQRRRAAPTHGRSAARRPLHPFGVPLPLVFPKGE